MSTSPDMATELPRPWYLRHIWVLAAIVGVLSLTIMRTCSPRTLATLPTLGAAPSFQLTAQDGSPFDSKSLAGKVWIASFAFTSCRTECPMIGKANQAVQAALSSTGVQLVTFTVDPEFDTPARMSEWGRQFEVDAKRWHLLTGARPELERIVIDGFKTHMSDRKVEGGLVQVAHTMKLVLVDAHGLIRYYFDAENPEAMKLIVDHAKALEREYAQHQGDRS